MPESITVLTVADREADIYDFLATQRPENSQLLIRAYHNRYESRHHPDTATWKLVSTHSPPDVKPDFVKKDVSKA